MVKSQGQPGGEDARTGPDVAAVATQRGAARASRPRGNLSPAARVQIQAGRYGPGVFLARGSHVRFRPFRNFPSRSAQGGCCHGGRRHAGQFLAWCRRGRRCIDHPSHPLQRRAHPGDRNGHERLRRERAGRPGADPRRAARTAHARRYRHRYRAWLWHLGDRDRRAAEGAGQPRQVLPRDQDADGWRSFRRCGRAGGVLQAHAGVEDRPDADPQFQWPQRTDAAFRGVQEGRQDPLHRLQHVGGCAVPADAGRDARPQAGFHPGGLFDRQPQREREDPADGQGHGHRGAGQRALRRPRPHAVPARGRQAAAGFRQGHRRDHVGAILPQVHHRQPGGDRGDPGQHDGRIPARQPGRRPRRRARRRDGQADGTVLGFDAGVSGISARGRRSPSAVRGTR